MQSAGTWFFAAVNQHKKISKLKNISQKTHQMETKYDFELNYGSFGRRMYLVLNLFAENRSSIVKSRKTL